MSEHIDNSLAGYMGPSLATASTPLFWQPSKLLEAHSNTENVVESTILALQGAFPSIPPPQINLPDGPWPTAKPRYIHKTHIMTEAENCQLAIENITRAGKTLDESETKFLQYILCYPSGWSATSPNHHEDSWVHYIKHQFSHIENLQPILDDMTWPEEIKRLPEGYGPGFPEYLLLANSESFYFYLFDPECLFRAGNTLEEVYWGLRQRRWVDKDSRRWCGEDDSHEMWDIEADNGEEYDQYDYFPVWRGEEEDGRRTHVLSYPLLPFIPHVPVHFDDDCGYNSG